MRTPALLSELLDAVPAGMLTARTTPRGTDVPVLGSVLLDVTDAVPADVQGGVLHMVGVLPGDPGAADLVRQVGGLRYTAVAVKRRGQSLVDLAAVAKEFGVAVLEVNDDAGWSAVHAAVTSVIGAAGLRTSSSRASATDELHEVANAVAAAFGGSVSIEDLDRRVIAYSSIPGQRIDAYREAGILQRLVPSKATDRQQYQQVYNTRGVVRFPAAGDELPRSVTAIRAGEIPLGTIWAIESDDGVTDQQLQALQDGAAIASVHLLRLRHADEIGQLARGDALVSLLDTNLPTEMLLARIGMSPGPARMLLAAPVDPASRTQLSTVSAAAGRYLAAYAPSAVVATLPGWTCILMPDRGNDETVRLAHGISGEATRALGTEVRVAYSSTDVYPADVASMYAEVMETATVAEAQQHAGPVVHMSDIADHILLQAIDDVVAARPYLASLPVARLVEHDASTGGSLAESLLVWLEEQGDARACAERLSTHPNTIRYRVRRAFTVMGHPAWDADMRLATWIRLRLVLRSTD